jgi:hydroxyacylglutathione hydrolase
LVDPVDSSLVQQYLVKQKLKPTVILNTHHHFDHVGGNCQLKAWFNPLIIGPEGDIPCRSQIVQDQEIIETSGIKIEVIATPGHTLDSICYYISTGGLVDQGVLFTGDTLFISGCGRLFEGTALQLWESLKKLRALPEDTLVYCGHDYTWENCKFALTIEPDNVDLNQRYSDVLKFREKSQAMLFSTIGREKLANPFLRCDLPQIAMKLGSKTPDPAAVFAQLRRQKDDF